MNNPNEENEELHEKAWDHICKGVKALWKSGASLQTIEYAVAAGLEDAGMLSVNVIINVKESK